MRATSIRTNISGKKQIVYQGKDSVTIHFILSHLKPNSSYQDEYRHYLIIVSQTQPILKLYVGGGGGGAGPSRHKVSAKI
jgi:hypothetical protein